MTEKVLAKICHVGDIHLKGKSFDRAKEAFRQIVSVLQEEKPDYLILSGDVFDHPNVSDRFSPVGKLQALFAHFLTGALLWCPHVIIADGNHDKTTSGYSALSVYGHMENVTVCHDVWFSGQTPVGIVVIPWLNKNGPSPVWGFDGLDQSLSDIHFSQWVCKKVVEIQNIVERCGRTVLIFGHCDIQGTKPNDYYTVEGGGFAFTEDQLRSTGAAYVSLSHIHKRMGPYVGALYQNNFGEEGNPQGFEIITVYEDGRIEEKYVPLDLPGFKTVTLSGGDSVLLDSALSDGHTVKVRFIDEEAYENHKDRLDQIAVVETLYNKKTRIVRSKEKADSPPSEWEFLEKFVSKKTLPYYLSKEIIMEAAR